MALLKDRLSLPEHNAATYVDVTAPCANSTTNPDPALCSSTQIDFLSSPRPRSWQA